MKKNSFFDDSTWQVLIHCEKCHKEFDKSISESKHVCDSCLQKFVKEMQGDQI